MNVDLTAMCQFAEPSTVQALVEKLPSRDLARIHAGDITQVSKARATNGHREVHAADFGGVMIIHIRCPIIHRRNLDSTKFVATIGLKFCEWW